MAFHYSAKAFVKVYRKFLDWEWYGDVNTKTLFLHCLLKANWKPGSWKGVNYQAGEFITSLQTLAVETNLTIKQIRGSLDKLKRTGEVADRTERNFRIITVNNWDKYQNEGKDKGKERADLWAGQGQGKGNSRRIYKNNKEEYKEGDSPTSKEVVVVSEEKKAHPGDPGYLNWDEAVDEGYNGE